MDKRKMFLHRLGQMSDKELKELAGDLVDFSNRKGTKEIRSFIVDPRMRVILENMDPQQVRRAVLTSAASGTVSLGGSLLLGQLLGSPDQGLSQGAGALPGAAAFGYAGGRNAAKVKQLVAVLKELRARQQSGRS